MGSRSYTSLSTWAPEPVPIKVNDTDDHVMPRRRPYRPMPRPGVERRSRGQWENHSGSTALHIGVGSQRRRYPETVQGDTDLFITRIGSRSTA